MRYHSYFPKWLHPFWREGGIVRYIICYSGGKDSTATVILHYLNKKDEIKDSEIIFSEVMFDKNRGISGENPLHIDFILNKTFPLFESWGYKTRILRSEKDYLDCFYHKVTRSKYPDRIGKYRGFPIAGMCSINRDCKVRAIKKYLKNKNDRTEYIGIAADEQKRLERLKDYQSSILNEYGYTEKMAYDLCEEYDLLSPIYKISNRGGCWFCPNSKLKEFAHVKEEYPELWNKLYKLSLEGDMLYSKYFKYNKTFDEVDKTVDKYIERTT